MPDEPSSEIEIYPMPSFPTLAVSDIRASAAWYCEAAGFSMPGLGDLPSLVHLRQQDARILEGPLDRPWNVRELVVLDPDGYRLVFNGPVPGAELRSFDEIVADAAKGFQH